MVFADKMNYQLDLVFIESKKTSLSRYVTKIPDNLLSMFCDFSLSCIQYHQKDEKLDYILSKVEKVKKSNFFDITTRDLFLSKIHSAQNVFLSHGDSIPPNLLLTTEDDLKVIDWEFYDYRPKFFDLSLLYIALKDKNQKEEILNFVKKHNSLDSFFVGLVINLEKELRIHLSDKDIEHEVEYLQSINRSLREIIF